MFFRLMPDGSPKQSGDLVKNLPEIKRSCLRRRPFDSGP